MDKLCPRCNTTKPRATEFRQRYKIGAKGTRIKNGVQSWCNDCMNEYKRGHHQRNKEKYNAMAKQNYIDNKQSYLDRAKKYATENREKYLTYQQEYHKTHTPPDRSRYLRLAIIAAGKRRARMLSVENTLTELEIEVLLMLYDSRCAYCYSDEKVCLDHYIPITKDGGTVFNNMVPACKSCNSSKGAKHPSEWRC